MAYPHRADNPITGLVRLIGGLTAEPLDRGSDHFDPSHLEFTSVDVGNETVNLIPGQACARFNIRYNDCHSQSSLKALVAQRAKAAAGDTVNFSFEWQPSNADVFITKPGPFTAIAVEAIAEVTGRTPELSTSGGTSDARFIKNYCPVLEFGLVGQTMHQVDECAPVADLHMLTAIYRRMIEKYFSQPVLFSPDRDSEAGLSNPPAPDKARAAGRPGRRRRGRGRQARWRDPQCSICRRRHGPASRPSIAPDAGGTSAPRR